MSTSWWLWQALLPPTASSLAGLWPLHAEHTVLKSKDRRGMMIEDKILLLLVMRKTRMLSRTETTVGILPVIVAEVMWVVLVIVMMMMMPKAGDDHDWADHLG
eukprot:s462_g40.t2